MEKKDNLLEVLKTLYKWKKAIIYVCLFALVGSILISLLLSNYYESTTIFYAASPDLAKPEPVGNFPTDIDYYGNDEDIDRILTIAESGVLFSFIIAKFNLYEHYDIDTANVKAPFKVRQAFASHYNVIKTKFNAIELSVEDKDQKLAAEMTNAARDKTNELARQLIKSSQQKQLDTHWKNLENKQKELQILEDSLTNLRERYGIFNTRTQSESIASSLTKAESRLARNNAKLNLLQSVSSGVPADSLFMLKAEVKGLEEEVKSLQANLKKFNSGMASVETLFQLHDEAGEQLGLDKERFKQLKAAFESEVSAIHLVEKGTVPVVKSRPKRSILVIASLMIAFLLSCIGALIFDTYRDFKWSDITDA